MATIPISSINSQGIQRVAREHGIVAGEDLGVHEHPEHDSADWRVGIYRIGGVLVAATNGDPVWEDSPDWIGLMKEYGLDAKAQPLTR